MEGRRQAVRAEGELTTRGELPRLRCEHLSANERHALSLRLATAKHGRLNVDVAARGAYEGHEGAAEGQRVVLQVRFAPSRHSAAEHPPKVVRPRIQDWVIDACMPGVDAQLGGGFLGVETCP